MILLLFFLSQDQNHRYGQHDNFPSLFLGLRLHHDYIIQIKSILQLWFFPLTSLWFLQQFMTYFFTFFSLLPSAFFHAKKINCHDATLVNKQKRTKLILYIPALHLFHRNFIVKGWVFFSEKNIRREFFVYLKTFTMIERVKCRIWCYNYKLLVSYFLCNEFSSLIFHLAIFQC